MITKLDDLARQGDGAHPQDIVQGQTIFKAMNTAGIFGHVTANAAGDLRAGVRSIVEMMRRHGFGDGEITDTRLDDRRARQGIYRQNPVESCQG